MGVAYRRCRTMSLREKSLQDFTNQSKGMGPRGSDLCEKDKFAAFVGRNSVFLTALIVFPSSILFIQQSRECLLKKMLYPA